MQEEMKRETTINDGREGVFLLSCFCWWESASFKWGRDVKLRWQWENDGAKDERDEWQSALAFFYLHLFCLRVWWSQTSRMIDDIDKLKCPYWMRSGPWVLPQRFLRTDRQTKTTHSHTALLLFATTALSTITFQLFKTHTHKGYLYDCSISTIPAHFFFFFLLSLPPSPRDH